MKKIVFITGNDNFFGQTRKPWVSMDSDMIVNRLIKNGFDVTKITIAEIANSSEKITNSIIFYGFSQNKNIRLMLNDIIRYLDNGTNMIVPSYDFLKCHENKGFQELFKRKIGIESLWAYYFSNYDDIQGFDFDFPLVFKPISGSNSRGVVLIQNQEQLKKHIKSKRKFSFATKLDLFRRRYFRTKKSYPEYPNYSNKEDLAQYLKYIVSEQCFVLQEFVPNLTYDIRVLIMNDKYYIVKRHVNDGDFRASGAKNFDFDYNVDSKLLDYAKLIYEKMNTPFLSLDLYQSNNQIGLFEYQALHFGTSVYMKNDTYYYYNNDSWNTGKYELNIEIEIADGLSKYLKKKKL